MRITVIVTAAVAIAVGGMGAAVGSRTNAYATDQAGRAAAPYGTLSAQPARHTVMAMGSPDYAYETTYSGG